MMKAVPDVRVSMVISLNAMPGFWTKDCFASSPVPGDTKDCTADQDGPISCVWTSSPVISCSPMADNDGKERMIIDALIYGMIPRAKIVT
jgi:hypothetical protein